MEVDGILAGYDLHTDENNALNKSVFDGVKLVVTI